MLKNVKQQILRYENNVNLQPKFKIALKTH